MKMVVLLLDDADKVIGTCTVRNISAKPVDNSDLWDNWTSRLKIAGGRAVERAYASSEKKQ